MHLFLLRHADASMPAIIDDDRALSEKGLSQSKRVARFCREHELVPDLIVTSPIRRARETAHIVAEQLGVSADVAPFLSAGMLAETALGELKAYRTFDSLMLVGHEPDLSRLAGYLLGIAPAAAIHLRKASLTLLILETLRPGTAELDFTLPCKLM